jgi:hypothetical protein
MELGVPRSTSVLDLNLKHEKPNYDMAGLNERATETIERLKQARSMRKSGKRSSIVSPMGRIEEEPAQRSGVGGWSEVDDEDRTIDDDNTDGGNGYGDMEGEEVRESSEEE